MLSPTRKKISQLIFPRLLRKKAELTQEQLAENSQISSVYLSEVESGKKSPTLSIVEKLCSAFDLNPIELFDFSEVTDSEIKQLEETFFVLLRKASKDKNIRNMQRLIIEPRFRGLGLACWLVRKTLNRMDIPIIEAASVMGHVNNFLERAGMQKYEAPMQRRCVQIQEAFGIVGIKQEDLIDVEAADEKLNNLLKQPRAFIENQIRLFLESYGRRRKMSGGVARTRYVLSKLTARPVYYCWLNDKFNSVILKGENR